MNNHIIVFQLFAYTGMLLLAGCCVAYAGDFIDFLIKKLEDGGAHAPRPRAKTSPKKRRQPAAAA